MIRVRVFRDGAGRISGFVAEGHSGWGPRGFDIVCAGVAALTQAAVLGLVRHVGAEAQVDASDGYLACRLVGPASPALWDQAEAILATMVLGLREIAQQYPQHLELTEEDAAQAGPGGPQGHGHRRDRGRKGGAKP